MATINKKRQLGRQVSIVGAGLSQFGAFANKDSRDLFVEAFQDMVKDMDRGFDIQDIECAYVGNYSSDLLNIKATPHPSWPIGWVSLPYPSLGLRTPVPAAAAPLEKVSWPSPAACTTWS